MLRMGSRPASVAMRSVLRHPAGSFHSSEMRPWRTPLAAMRSRKIRWIDSGVSSNPLRPPMMTRNGVSRMRPATSRIRSQGSSCSSRTHFLMCELDISSMPLKPARSMRSPTASIIPVRMDSAHRLWCPSRNVVSTNSMGSMGIPFSLRTERLCHYHETALQRPHPSFRRKPESRGWEGVWIPAPYRVRGRLFAGMTDAKRQRHCGATLRSQARQPTAAALRPAMRPKASTSVRLPAPG